VAAGTDDRHAGRVGGPVAAVGQGPSVTILLPLPVIQTCQVLTMAVAAAGISGVIATAEARLQGRRGPRLLQPYFDLWKSFGRSRWRRRAPARSSCWRRWCRSRVS